ncbi:unnamed protein product [Lactuca saligna]|uniref:Uncharacterized protein n=1 Tax=Lactuca saligna TaxID=75948 RepID=A0AA35YG75_LACSI|nr:unnamed protein product [Lactuca saligna]
MSNNQGGSKGQQVNNCVKSEYQGDVNRSVSIGPGSQGYDESRTSRIDENVQDRCNQVAVEVNPNAPPQAPPQQLQAPPQAPPQQLQGSLVHWERFLHVRSIKVMLVEDDDCTRHIVTALLRNCNYEVIQAANGLQAWKILENLSNHIDIVLTEVVMPCLSGIGLFCKIMSHKTRKNIPVIMMSSHDSMGLVFKCLSKGAVDFLVKPIRKNELKNLWQHVWRRCHSSSGSGSESGTQAQKSVNSKSNVRYDNSSKDGDDNNENTSGGSDDGSGTQSSWTKHGIERESPESAIPSNQIYEHPDSTCGIVIRSLQTQPIRDINNHKPQPYTEIAISMENVKTEKIMNANGIHDSNGVETEDLGTKGHVLHLTVTRKKFKMVAAIYCDIQSFQPSHGQNLRKGQYCNLIRYDCSQPDNRSNLVKKESKRDVHSEGYLIYQGSSEQVIPNDMTPGNVVRDQELHIHQHHHVHHYHNIETDEPLPMSNDDDEDDFGRTQLAADAPHCGSSNIMGGGNGKAEAKAEAEANLQNYSLNKSASGSRHGSNVPNDVNFEVAKLENNVCLRDKNKITDHHNHNHNHNDNDISAQRKAALTKFRQKRELRCFQKKVRYQNRKRLAEQRPRVRGQFVNGKSRDNSTNAADG